MARIRTATERVYALQSEAVTRALEASAAQSPKDFYASIGMRNPSRSHYVRYQHRLHSLKAIATFALQKENPATLARDFRTLDAARRFRDLKLDVVRLDSKLDGDRERRWISVLSRKRQAAFRESLFDIYSGCVMSDCTTPFALEAAHVLPVKNGGLDLATNGVLLRADLHKLFDGDLIAIDPSDGRIHVADTCLADYGDLMANVKFEPVAGGPLLSDFVARWKSFQPHSAV